MEIAKIQLTPKQKKLRWVIFTMDLIMKTCFVAQPFNLAPYEKRYEDTFRKAIEAAGLRPYRVDADPSASIPILKIEEGIRDVSVFFVEISEDNPNVWLEFGLAHAFKKEMVIVCSEDRRSKFPFDMQHRRVIKYKSESESDFSELKRNIIDAISSAIERSNNVEQLPLQIKTASDSGLSEFEIALLVSIANSADGHDQFIARYVVANEMEKIGYNRLASNLAAMKLIKRRFIKEGQTVDYNGDQYSAYAVLEDGWGWLELNPDLILYIRVNSDPRKRKLKVESRVEVLSDTDDIPF